MSALSLSPSTSLPEDLETFLLETKPIETVKRIAELLDQHHALCRQLLDRATSVTNFNNSNEFAAIRAICQELRSIAGIELALYFGIAGNDTLH